MIPINHYLILSAILFTLGIFGVMTRRNIMIILLSIELMLNGANLSFVASSRAWGHLDGQVISLFVIAIAASEVAIGLAIAVLLVRNRGTLDPNQMNTLKW